MIQTPLTALIVDDDESGRANLHSLLGRYCPNINVTGTAASAQEALRLLKAHARDVVFLDIRMPGEDGFALIDHYADLAHEPLTVFVTAYDQYAIKAIRHKAFDYLLKPIDVDELQDCVQRLVVAANAPETAGEEDTSDRKISISHARGTRIIRLKDLLYLEGDKNYTVLYIAKETGTEKFVVSRTLGDFEASLPHDLFFRVHKSYIINLEHMQEHRNMDGGQVLMSNGRHIEISRRRSGLFRQFLHEHYAQPGRK